MQKMDRKEDIKVCQKIQFRILLIKLKSSTN